MNGSDWIVAILFFLFIFALLAQVPIGVWFIILLILGVKICVSK